MKVCILCLQFNVGFGDEDQVEDKVDDAVIYEISSFESIVLINDNGVLKRQSLPIQAQLSPIKSSLVTDINGDGNKDILTVGKTIYNIEQKTKT